jgi:thioesterase domain-containing protein
MRSGPPRVFLLPGIFGDEPPLADFRAVLAGRVAFELLDYPDIDRPSSEIRDFDAIVSHTIQRIRSLPPSGEVHIIGYSFGGPVGFAAARRLQASGHRVGVVAFLDSLAPSLKVATSFRLTRNRDAAPGAWGVGADAASRLLIAAGLSEAVRSAIGPTGRIFGAEAANGLRRLFLQNLRGRALRGVSLGRWDGPILLFRAQEQPSPDLPTDLGWGAHCAAVRSVTLTGDHNSMIGTDHLAANAARIWSEVAPRICQPEGG